MLHKILLLKIPNDWFLLKMQSLCYHDQLLAQALLLRIQGKKSVPAKRYLEKNSERESTPTVHFMKYKYIPSIYWNMAQPNMWVKNSFKSQPAAHSWCPEPWFPNCHICTWDCRVYLECHSLPQCRDRSWRMLCCSGSPAGIFPCLTPAFRMHRSLWKEGSGHCSTSPCSRLWTFDVLFTWETIL